MPKPFTYDFPQERFRSIHQVRDHMYSLTEALRGTDLENLCAFNQTYWIITKNVAGQLGSGYFRDDAKMEELDIHFAGYYFNALKGYLGNRTVAPAWQTLFETCRENTTYQFIYMALGVNAHVNNDLPFTLRDLHEPVEEDFLAVNGIISRSLAEVVTGLQEESPLLNAAQNSFTGLYGFFLERVITNWRENAWRSFRQLQAGTIGPQEIENSALEIAGKLRGVRSMADIPRLFQIVNPAP